MPLRCQAKFCLSIMKHVSIAKNTSGCIRSYTSNKCLIFPTEFVGASGGHRAVLSTFVCCCPSGTSSTDTLVVCVAAGSCQLSMPPSVHGLGQWFSNILERRGCCLICKYQGVPLFVFFPLERNCELLH